MEVYKNQKQMMDDYKSLDRLGRLKVENYILKLVEIQMMKRELEEMAEEADSELNDLDNKMMELRPTVQRRCSFCASILSGTEKLIEGPHHIYICENCAHICVDIFDDVKKKSEEVTDI